MYINQFYEFCAQIPTDSCCKASDTAGCFVRLRETSVCMRLEEEEEDTADADARAFGICDQHRWSDCLMMELFRLI